MGMDAREPRHAEGTGSQGGMTMPKIKDTARLFVLRTLTEHADRELRVSDLFELAGGKFQRGNLENLMPKLHSAGLVTKAIEPDRSVWWGIA